MDTFDIGGKPVQLSDGETLIWQGQPMQGILRNPVHIGWGIAFLAFGFWLVTGDLGVILGLAAMFTGGYLAFVHAIVEKNRRAGTYYALTNQRAIVAYSLGVLTHPILPESKFTLKKGRFDTVLFTTDQRGRAQQTAHLRGVGFGHLENGEEVYNLMLGLQKDHSAPNQT